MRKSSLMALASIVTCVCSVPCAFGQDTMSAETPPPDTSVAPPPPPAADSMNTTDTLPPAETKTGSDAEKHWAVTVGAMLFQPRNKNIGQNIKQVDGSNAFTLSANFYITNNWAVELWAADKVHHRFHNALGRKMGTVKQEPYSISAQYEFGDLSTPFRPFVGLGYYQSRFTNAELADKMNTKTPWSFKRASGFMGTIGLDMTINENWFGRLDWRFLTERPEAEYDGSRTYTKLKLNPWTVGFSIGARF